MKNTIKKEIFSIAKKLAEKEVKNENKLTGWEDIEDSAWIRMQVDPTQYVLMAIIEYLDGKRLSDMT